MRNTPIAQFDIKETQLGRKAARTIGNEDVFQFHCQRGFVNRMVYRLLLISLSCQEPSTNLDTRLKTR